MWQRIKQDFKEQVWDNEQVLKLRQKFAELDQTTQSYVLIGAFAGFVLVLLVTFLSLWGRTVALKSDIARMEDQIRFVQNVAAKIQEAALLETAKSSDPMLRELDTTGDASAFATIVAQKSLVPKAGIEVAAGAKPGTATLKLNKISLRQLLRALYMIEKSNSGSSVDHLAVDAKDDPDGYLWAELQIHKDVPKEPAKGGT